MTVFVVRMSVARCSKFEERPCTRALRAWSSFEEPRAWLALKAAFDFFATSSNALPMLCAACTPCVWTVFQVCADDLPTPDIAFVIAVTMVLNAPCTAGDLKASRSAFSIFASNSAAALSASMLISTLNSASAPPEPGTTGVYDPSASRAAIAARFIASISSNADCGVGPPGTYSASCLACISSVKRPSCSTVHKASRYS
jgi:hypothetical protein